MSIAREGDRTSIRGQWTLKSKLLTVEVQAAIRLAAAKAEQPIGDWCAQVLHEQARIVLGRPIEKPLPPARLEEVVAESFQKLADQQREEIAATESRLEERLSAEIRAIARENRRGRWRRY